MEGNADSTATATVNGGDVQSGASSAAMTYASLETLSRLNTEDLTSILSSTGHRHDEEENGAHYADATADAEGATEGYIVATTAEGYHQGAYVVTGTASTDETANNDNDQSTTDNEASGLSVHSYCKPSNSQEAEGRAAEVRNSATAAAELIDLKTVLPGPTTRRVLLIDDGHGDLEMAKSDVEFLLRGDAAGIVLREGKRSEVWARFGKVTFQGRKVKGYVACIYCRQVYAFGDAHSTGTSTLKKHRCLAQSIVSTSGTSPLTPTSDRQQTTPTENTSYVNFPSPSVIVSIATAVRETAEPSPGIATRYLAPSDRDELVRNAGVVLGSGPVSAAAFLQLSKALVELGAKHGAALVEDLTAIFSSPNFETVLPSIANEYRNHFVDEARSVGGIGLSISVQPSGSSIGVTIGISYCVDGSQNMAPFLRQTPLTHVQLSIDQDTSVRVAQLIQRTLKQERLEHLRRAIVSNSADILKEAFTGQMAVPCAQHLINKALTSAFEVCSVRQDWRTFRDTLQKMANIVQTMGWESQLSKAVRPGDDWMELVMNISSQSSELYKLFQDASVAPVWNQLDRHLLGHLAAFYSSIATITSKVGPQTTGPTLCNVLLARSHLSSLCTPRCQVDPPALSALKHALLEALSCHWPLEMVHRLACVLHPAFKHMRRLDVSDRERMETYAMLRNLLRQTDQPVSDHILRNTLEHAIGRSNGELKRKMNRDNSAVAKRQRTAPPALTVATDAFDFSDLADFSLNCETNVNVVPEQRDELDLYLEEKVIQQDLVELANVLVYWKHRQSVFPGLSQLAFWLLSLPSFAVHTAPVAKSDAVLQRQLFQVVAQNSFSSTSLD